MQGKKKDVKRSAASLFPLENKNENLGTKIAPLPGDLNARMVRCGKANCKCVKGELHGPYFVRRWRVYGKRYAKYVKKGDVLTAKLACETRRQQQRQARQELREATKTLRGFRFGLLDLVLQGRV